MPAGQALPRPAPDAPALRSLRVNLERFGQIRPIEVSSLVSWRLWHLSVGAGELDRSINLARPVEAKGLEFDGVVVLDPAAVVQESERGY